MATFKVRHFVKKKNRDGSYRYYWQPSPTLKDAGWKQMRLADQEHEAIAQAEGVNRHVDEWRAGQKDSPDTSLPGSVNALIDLYKGSKKWLKLADKTQKDYGYNLEIIKQWAGDMPLSAVTSKSVQVLYDTIASTKPRKAHLLVAVIRLLFSFAEQQRLIPQGSNPASKIDMEYKAAKGKLWTPQAVAHMVQTADDMGYHSIGTAIMINEWTGQRLGDVLALTMDDYSQGEINLTQNKTGAEVEGLCIDEIPELKSRIEAQIKQNRQRTKATDAMIQQDSGRAEGKPYKADHFGHCFSSIREQAATTMPQVADLIFKDLRHTAVTRLAESGATVPEIAAVTGHTFTTCQQIVDRYNVRTRRMARNAFIKRKQAGGQ